MRKKSFSSKVNHSWKKYPAFWAIGLIVLTAIINRGVDLVLSSKKDEVFIELAKRLTGQADEATVARIKDQVVMYFTDKFRTEYITRNEFAKANMTFSDLFKTNVSELSSQITAVAKLQDPDARYRQLLCEIGRESEGGHVLVASERGWKILRKMHEILQDDRTLRAPYVAEALLQMALRQGNVQDEIKRDELKEMTLHAMSYYENSRYNIGRGGGVYKALVLLLYDTEKFGDFVLRQVNENPAFEKELKDSRFLKDSFFASDLWPLNKKRRL